MKKKRIVLYFPTKLIDKPITYHLVKDYNLVFNILQAKIMPNEEGLMVLELSGSKKNFKSGISFLRDQGVRVENASQEVKRNNERCMQCGACTAVCLTGALSIKRPEMSVEFDQKKCSICELCVPACPARAMIVRPTTESFFE